MPKGATQVRSEQVETVAGIIHRCKRSGKWKNGLKNLLEDQTLTDAQKRAVKHWKIETERAQKIPTRFVEKLAALTAEAQEVWQKARMNDKFSLFAPYLEKIVAMQRKKSDYLKWKNHPYDPLLDLYEPDMTTEQVKALFTQLKSELVPLVKKIEPTDNSFLSSPCPEDKQMEFAKWLLAAINFNFTHGRLDLSTHPFSSASHPHDSRITTRIRPDMLLSHIRSVLHEAGHSFYETGLNPEFFGTPLGQALSLGMHESQSRLWETQIGLSKPFWQFAYTKLREFFPHFEKIPLETFLKGINHVQSSLIRVEADEVTYGLHVILRFEIELELIEGKLKIKDLPEAWKAKMKDLLGIVPKNDREGCLQDVHWSAGLFGYFPTYALGSMWAAQLFAAFKKQTPSWESEIISGNFTSLHKWLSQNVWRHGRRYTSDELLTQATGTCATHGPFVSYLTDKYITQ